MSKEANWKYDQNRCVISEKSTTWGNYRLCNFLSSKHCFSVNNLPPTIRIIARVGFVETNRSELKFNIFEKNSKSSKLVFQSTLMELPMTEKKLLCEKKSFWKFRQSSRGAGASREWNFPKLWKEKWDVMLQLQNLEVFKRANLQKDGKRVVRWEGKTMADQISLVSKCISYIDQGGGSEGDTWAVMRLPGWAMSAVCLGRFCRLL